MSAPLIAIPSILAASIREPDFDPIEFGMEHYGDYPLNERYNVIDSYPQNATTSYSVALQAYVAKIARGVKLVSTAAQGGSKLESSRVHVSPALAAVAVENVVWHETNQRLGIMEERYRETGHRRSYFSGTTLKHGPIDAVYDALSIPKANRSHYQDDATAIIVEHMMPSTDAIADRLRKAGGRAVAPATLAALIHGIVPAQTDLERGVYQNMLSDWQPSTK